MSLEYPPLHNAPVEIVNGLTKKLNAAEVEIKRLRHIVSVIQVAVASALEVKDGNSI
jgi:hypothetical protein